jgi:ferric-dicitrate binding protein FerR (iron transport regulator)
MTPDKRRLDAVLQAAEWLLRNESESLTEAEKGEFLAWLIASRVNVREYLGVARAARQLPDALKKYAELHGSRDAYLMRMHGKIRARKKGDALTSSLAKRLGLAKRDIAS